MDKDYLTTALMPWQWITGGNFSIVLVSIFILITYIKYQKAIYPIVIGALFLPISAAIFPSVFLTWGIIMAGITIAVSLWYAYISQTNET